MKYRPLGRPRPGETVLTVSEVGFGGWGIGGRTAGATSYGDTDDTRSLAALHAALDQGITLFDTAPAYGDGHSEELIGRAFAGRRDQVVIATKVGQERFSDPPDFSPAGLRRSLDGSLHRLKVDDIDLLQLHSPPPDALARLPEIAETMADFRREGKIRHFGVSVKAPAEALTVLDCCRPAAIQLNLNMLDWRAVDCGALERAAAEGVGIIARTPLCFGFLSGGVSHETRFAAGDHRAAWPKERLVRWTEAAAAMLAAAGDGPAGPTVLTPLRFCLSFPAVSCVIPGILSSGEVQENAAAADHGPLDPATLERLAATYRDLGL